MALAAGRRQGESNGVPRPQVRGLTPPRAVSLPCIVAWLLAVAVLLAGWAGFRGVGRWLVREDPLARADAIVILSGGMPYRAEEAAQIYRAAGAPEVWITRPQSPASELAGLGIRFIGEEQYDRQILMDSGVPADDILILPDEIVDTEQELREVARSMRDEHKSTVIIVTSPEHTRRVHALWSRLADPGQKAIVRAARRDPFDRDHWWRNTRDAYSVLRELLGLANAWLGLRVRPARRAATLLACLFGPHICRVSWRRAARIRE
jgi:uncharacterized SAM-binding protein YcdF (DUF218 family)